MADKNIWLWIIGIAIVIALGMFIQKSYTLFILPGSATLTRTTASTQVIPGATFTVTYSTSQAIEGKWFVGWSDVVTGGCTPAAVNFFLSSGDPPVLTSDSKSFTFTAPSSGSCTFTGYYQFAEGIQTNFQDLTVTIGGTCIPDNSCAANTCIGQTCTNNCGQTVQGTKTCGVCTSGTTQACTSSNGCSGTQTCTSSGTWGTCTTALTKCSDGSCKADCGIITPTGWCTFAEKLALFPMTGTKCTDGSIIIGILALFGIILIGKLSK